MKIGLLLCSIVLLCNGLLSCKKQPDTPILNHEAIVTTLYRFQYGYEDGPVGVAAAQSVVDIVFDSSDNLYFADKYGSRIRKITPGGIVSTFAGTNQAGFKDGTRDQAQLFYPKALVFDNAGNLYVAQSYAIRKITLTGDVTTFVGIGTPGIGSTIPKNGDTIRYPVIEGSVLFDTPQALVFDKSNNLFVLSGAGVPRIVKITPNKELSLFYGTPFSTSDGTIPGTKQLIAPNALALDQQGNILISDSGLGMVKLTPNGQSVYFTGDGYIGYVNGPAEKAEFLGPTGAVSDKVGNIYVGDAMYIRKITPDGTVTTIAGSGNNHRLNSEPLKDGLGSQAQISNPASMAFDSKGNLYVVDDGGIRKITFL